VERIRRFFQVIGIIRWCRHRKTAYSLI
jgi:hypothetical protein